MNPAMNQLAARAVVEHRLEKAATARLAAAVRSAPAARRPGAVRVAVGRYLLILGERVAGTRQHLASLDPPC